MLWYVSVLPLVLFTSFVFPDFDEDAMAYEEELHDGTRALNEQESGADRGDDEWRDNLLKEDDDRASQSEGEEPIIKRERKI